MLLATAAIVMIMTIVWRDVYFRETFRYSLQGLALMPVFYFAIKGAAHFPFTMLNHPCIASLGIYSYAIYLIHYIVIKVIEKKCPVACHN
jgi:peptidoglycan/LPS O-acetylase OafA/YrhL